MKLVHYYIPGQGGVWGLIESERVHPVATDTGSGGAFLASLLQWPDPARVLAEAYATARNGASIPFDDLLHAEPDPGRPHLLPPIDLQEVWAAGVTYQRSKVARMEESEGAARFYDLVYDAERPELFFKGTLSRVSGPNGPVRIREDARWNVPEPEVALLVSPEMKLIGYTVGNDMSSRDIEGENPLYLPQAKVYRQSCGLGPVIWLDEGEGSRRPLEIRMEIERDGATAFSGETSTAQMKRTFPDLIEWLGRDNLFPHGVFLLTGTGLVPGDDFTLRPGDSVRITIPEIGTLRNTVVQGSAGA
ncbi:MAG TPA: fumarylacetoacetate hydrolase family protein [Armatimonadota bacterium]|nr:fumarylacetoacetate hydrolase family protein [Armatimonadota bacterium]